MELISCFQRHSEWPYQKLRSRFFIVLELRFSLRAPSSVMFVYYFLRNIMNSFFELIYLNYGLYSMFWHWFYLLTSISNFSSSILMDLKLFISPSSLRMLLTLELELRMKSCLSYFFSVFSSCSFGKGKTDWTLGREE